MGRPHKCGNSHTPEHRLSVSIRTLVLDFQNHWRANLDSRTPVVRNAPFCRRCRNALDASQTRIARFWFCRSCVHVHAQPVPSRLHGTNVRHSHTVVCPSMANRSDDLRVAGTNLACAGALCADRHRHGRHQCEFGDFCSSRAAPARPVCHLDHPRDRRSKCVTRTATNRCHDRTSAVVVVIRTLHPRQIRTS